MSGGHFDYQNFILGDIISQLIVDRQAAPSDERDATKTMRRMILRYTSLVDNLLPVYDKYMSSDFSEEDFLRKVTEILRNHKWEE